MIEIFRKALFLFNGVERKKLFAISSCVIVMGLAEMLGIAIILPFLAIVAKPAIIESNVYLASVYNFLSFSSTNAFMLFLGTVVFAVLVLGNTFSALTTWLIMRFSYNQGKRIAHNLLEKYLTQPYEFFLNRNSSELSTKIIMEIDRVVIGIFINSMQSFSKIILMLFVFGLLLIVEPRLALGVIGILGTSYWVIYQFVRKKLAHAGRLASETSTLRMNVLNEVFGAIKELKVLSRERNFIEAYDRCAAKYASAETFSQLSPLISRYLIEAIAFGGMVLMVIYLIATQHDISTFLPVLGLYAISGYRLMPAMQQLFAGVTSLKYHVSALDNIHTEMQLTTVECQALKKQALAFRQQLQLKNIYHAYPNADKFSLKDVSVDIPLHSTIGIVGPSGGGKTTLVDIILGLLKQQNGKILVDGQEISDHNMKQWQQNIGYVPQNIFLVDASIAHNIALGIKPSEVDMNAVIGAAKLANLHEFIISELAQGYNTFAGEEGVRLSGGQRQRIGIARALYHDPELLIFDEATSALDGLTEKVIIEAIKNLSHRKTIIFIAHRLNTVKDCDVIYVLNKGEILAQGSYKELLNSDQTFQRLVNSTADIG